MNKQCSGCGAPLYHIRDGDGGLVVRVASRSEHIKGRYRCTNCEKLFWLTTGKTRAELTATETEPLRWL